MANPDRYIHFATNRMVIAGDPPGFDNTLGPVGGVNLRFGKATVEAATGKRKRLKVYDENLSVSAAGGEALYGSKDFFDDITAMPANDIVFFIHGFGNSFDDGLVAANEIANATEKHVVALLWASVGKVGPSEYKADRDERAKPSGHALVRVLDIFLRWLGDRDGCKRNVHLVAHSMGNLVLEHALIALQEGRLAGIPRPVRFAHAILAASDVDANALADNMRLLASIARVVTVYHTATDGALTCSDEYMGNTTRLGHNGPANMYIIRDNVFAVDVTAVVSSLHDGPGDEDPLNHWFIRRTRAVINDLREVLADTPQDKIPRRAPSTIALRRYLLKKTAR